MGGGGYELRISRLTIDKLGVKLYDKASAVVAELIANAYDADAENVTVNLPLNVQLASQAGGKLKDLKFEIVVRDDGHGMTPDEARAYFLTVGADRRRRNGVDGARSREKKRPVIGRKGIGKLAPFGICKRIEVWSAGGTGGPRGYRITHFFMDFDAIVQDEEKPIPLAVGADDNKFSDRRGTTIRLTNFLAKRVPDLETFLRQLAARFVFATPDFRIAVVDTSGADPAPPVAVDPLSIPVYEETRVDLSTRPVHLENGKTVPVSGWMAMARSSYKHEEMTGVRIYARGKIVGTTRDFNQPAGFTGEFAMRSYLVGEVHAEWLDLDDGEDLVRTDRQDILWDSDYGQELRRWGSEIIREIAKISKAPRRERVRDTFLKNSKIELKAKQRFGDREIVDVAVDLAKSFGGFAAEDELGDEDYVNDLTDIILSVAPHRALMEAFREFSSEATKREVTISEMTDIFDKAQIAELASYAQVAAQRVMVINQLQDLISNPVDEHEYQALLSTANWLIEPSWTVISQNQSLKTFKIAFEVFYKQKYKKDVVLAITHETKRPDFTLMSIDGLLHIVEIKKPNYDFGNDDLERLLNYVEAFTAFFEANAEVSAEFPRGWTIDLIVDGVRITGNQPKYAWKQISDGPSRVVNRRSWWDFLNHARKVHEQFLSIHDAGRARKK